MKQRLRRKGKQTVQNLVRVCAGQHSDDIDALKRRVGELETEVQECRQLNLRLAELTDVVQELLLPISVRDEEKVAELMDRYAKGL